MKNHGGVWLLVSVFAMVGLSEAVERHWNSLLIDDIPSLTEEEVDYDGEGWWCEVFNLTRGETTDPLLWDADTAQFVSANADVTWGWWVASDAYEIEPFDFLADEFDEVFLRLYSNANPLEAAYFIDSLVVALPGNIGETPGLTDFEMQFVFANQIWEIPEPSVFLLLGLGMAWFGLGRRRHLA